MAERSFAREVEDLKLGDGEEFRGEGILAITKALLQSGVSYVGGYQGAPISHLMDVLADAKDVLDELGVHFENSASEAAAAATLAASVNYPIRGAVTFKAPVGINVASDAIANLASGGVTGGALIIIGEDYGEGSSIMQERSHPFAMKSQIWLLDPRPNLPTIVKAVEDGFELSEASHTPVMLEVRIRACHVHGRFIAKDNKKPDFTLREALENPRRDTDRVVLPPASYLHEREKVEQRWPAAVKFIKERKLNEFFGPETADVGIIVQGGMYNSVMRSLQQLGLADVYGETAVPIYCLNVTYPLIDDEVAAFAADKKAILDGRGRPAGIHRAGAQHHSAPPRYPDPDLRQGRAADGRRIHAAGRHQGHQRLPRAARRKICSAIRRRRPTLRRCSPIRRLKELAKTVPPRPPSFCIGCPERPIFAAMKLVQQELGPASDRRRHRLPSVREPAAVQHRRHHDGLRPRPGIVVGLQRQGRQEADLDHRRRRLLAQRPFHQHRQRRLQQARRRHHGRRQFLFGGDRRPGHSVLARDQSGARDQQHHRRRGEGRRRQMGAAHRPHLRRRLDARHVARGADHQRKRPESHRRLLGMHAQQAAPGEAAVPEIGARRRAQGARALRRRRGRLHRRSRLHPAFRLPVALGQAHRRSAQGRSGRGDRQQLRRLRQLRRGVGGRRALPVVLPRRHHPQSDRCDRFIAGRAALGDRLPAAPPRSPPDRVSPIDAKARHS